MNNITDFASTTLKAAQANTLASITLQVVDLNNTLTSNYLTAFNNWLENYTAGRISDKATAPQPPNGYVVGYFVDPTSGKGATGPYGEMPVEWAYPAMGTMPVCAVPPIPDIPQPFVPPVLPEPENIRNVPPGDSIPVGRTIDAPDGTKWQKHASPTPFGMAYYYAKVA